MYLLRLVQTSRAWNVRDAGIRDNNEYHHHHGVAGFGLLLDVKKKRKLIPSKGLQISESFRFGISIRLSIPPPIHTFRRCTLNFQRDSTFTWCVVVIHCHSFPCAVAPRACAELLILFNYFIKTRFFPKQSRDKFLYCTFKISKSSSILKKLTK